MREKFEQTELELKVNRVMLLIQTFQAQAELEIAATISSDNINSNPELIKAFLALSLRHKMLKKQLEILQSYSDKDLTAVLTNLDKSQNLRSFLSDLDLLIQEAHESKQKHEVDRLYVINLILKATVYLLLFLHFAAIICLCLNVPAAISLPLFFVSLFGCILCPILVKTDNGSSIGTDSSFENHKASVTLNDGRKIDFENKKNTLKGYFFLTSNQEYGVESVEKSLKADFSLA